MTEIKRLKPALAGLHVVATVFAVVVLGITAAAIDQINKAAAALNSISSGLSNLSMRKLLATRDLGGGAGAFLVIGFGAFLGFTLFVSISGFLLSFLLALCHLKPVVYDKTLGALASKSPAWAQWPFYELLIACVWSVFWLAAAAAASDSPLARISGYCTGVSSCDQINAVVALSWLSWLIWLAVVVLTAVEYGTMARKARKTQPANAAGNATTVSKPAGEQGKGDVQMAQAGQA